MGESILWKYWLGWALFSSPAIPIAFAWRWLLHGRRAATAAGVLPLSLATLSAIWFDAVLANWRFLGPLYGWLHYAIIGGNLVADLLAAFFSFLFNFSPLARRQRWAAALACLMLALEWGRMGVINR